jgi:type IV pilus assembly protein PilN
MRFNVNLASQPYEDAKVFYRRWGGALAVLALVALVLVVWIVASWHSASEIAAKNDELRARIQSLQDEKKKNQAVLELPENRGTREKAIFVNALIARKAFSWTRVFTDLEKIMPPRVHLVSIRPEVKDDRLSVHITVGGDSRERALELVHNLETAPRFTDAHLTAENTQATPAQNGDTIQFEITAFYQTQEGTAP